MFSILWSVRHLNSKFISGDYELFSEGYTGQKKSDGPVSADDSCIYSSGCRTLSVFCRPFVIRFPENVLYIAVMISMVAMIARNFAAHCERSRGRRNRIFIFTRRPFSLGRFVAKIVTNIFKENLSVITWIMNFFVFVNYQTNRLCCSQKSIYSEATQRRDYVMLVLSFQKYRTKLFPSKGHTFKTRTIA